MNLKKTNYILLLFMFLPFIGCDRTDVMPKFYGKSSDALVDETYTGDYVTLDFTAKESSLRSMFPIEDRSSGSTTSIKIKWVKDKEYDIKCVLYNKNNPGQTSYSNIKGRVTEVKSDGTATMKYKGTVRLANGSLAGGDWYMQLFMGLDNKYWKEANKSYQLGQRLITDDRDLTLDIPIASPWTKLNVNVAGNHIAAPVVQLNPLGTIFALEIESPLCDPMTFKRIELNTGLFRGIGVFKLGQFSENSVPSFEDPEGSFRSIKSSFDMNYYMPGNYQSRTPQKSKKIYFWAMPMPNIVSSDVLGKLYVSNDKYEYGLPIKANRGANLKERATQTIRMKVEDSDLIISEFYHYNPANIFASWNYSMIEIYNPTCRDIDLSQYSIIRQRKIYVDENDGFIAKSGFQPNDDVSVIQDALRQDIYIESKNSPSKVVDGRNAQDVHSSDCWNAINRYHVINGTYSKMLPPGKTVILCAGGTYNAYVNTRKSSDYPEAYVGNYIKTAQTRGDVHYVLAVDNGRKEGDRQWGTWGGVMQHGQKHVMILMKGEKPIDVTGPFTYRNRGGSKPQDIEKFSDKTTLDNYQTFTGQIPAFTAGDDWMSLVRKDWDHYPSPYWDNNKRDGNWDPDSRWILITGKGSGGTKLSSWGTRSPKSDYIDTDFINRTKSTVNYYPRGVDANAN